jgi:hypothetical protein
VRELLALALLDRVHDLDPELVLEAEVKDQHPVAGPELSG